MAVINEGLKPTGFDDRTLFPISSPAKPKRKGSHGLLHRMFSRHPNTPKFVSLELEDRFEGEALDNTEDLTFKDLKIAPCPYIYPLDKRLEPRIETACVVPRRLMAESIKTNVREAGESANAVHNCLVMDEANGESTRVPTSPESMRPQSSRLHKDMSAAATTDYSHRKDWSYSVRSCSERRYNLILPPTPPPINSDFAYLPSMHPPNEADRLTTSQSSETWLGTDIIWSPWQEQRARSLIQDAATKFALPWASVSFFDNDTEIVQAERGYSRHLIPRHESIASHVLLTSEVMTVLDTKKDYRFAGNPLVVGPPKIRFFAGAPLLSSKNEAIGVFAIFSPVPRASFSATERRELIGFSELALQDLSLSTGAFPDELNRCKPILRRGSFAGDTLRSSRPSIVSSISDEASDDAPNLITFRYHKPSKQNDKKPRVFINGQVQEILSDPLHHTPPHSDEFDAGPFSAYIEPKITEKRSNKYSVMSLTEQAQNGSNNPGSPTFENSSKSSSHLRQRSLSRSTLALRDQESHQTRDFRFLNVTSLSYEYVKQCIHPADSNDNRAVSIPISDIKESANDNRIDGLAQCKGEKVATNSCKASIALKEGSQQIDPYAEAQSEIEYWAKHLGFDIIYAVELIPRKLFMADSELVSPGGIETRVLVSYGLREPIDFDIAIHLSVLNGIGGITWENNKGKPEDYSKGFMMRLKLDWCLLEYRSKGVVFGAFRKIPEKSNERPELGSADIRHLRKVARIIKKSLHKVPSLRRPTYPVTELSPSPSPQAHAVNKAPELGRDGSDSSAEQCSEQKMLY